MYTNKFYNIYKVYLNNKITKKQDSIKTSMVNETNKFKKNYEIIKKVLSSRNNFNPEKSNEFNKLLNMLKNNNKNKKKQIKKWKIKNINKNVIYSSKISHSKLDFNFINNSQINNDFFKEKLIFKKNNLWNDIQALKNNLTKLMNSLNKFSGLNDKFNNTYLKNKFSINIDSKILNIEKYEYVNNIFKQNKNKKNLEAYYSFKNENLNKDLYDFCKKENFLENLLSYKNKLGNILSKNDSEISDYNKRLDNKFEIWNIIKAIIFIYNNYFYNSDEKISTELLEKNIINLKLIMLNNDDTILNINQYYQIFADNIYNYINLFDEFYYKLVKYNIIELVFDYFNNFENKIYKLQNNIKYIQDLLSKKKILFYSLLNKKKILKNNYKFDNNYINNNFFNLKTEKFNWLCLNNTNNTLKLSKVINIEELFYNFHNFYINFNKLLQKIKNIVIDKPILQIYYKNCYFKFNKFQIISEFKNFPTDNKINFNKNFINKFENYNNYKIFYGYIKNLNIYYLFLDNDIIDKLSIYNEINSNFIKDFFNLILMKIFSWINDNFLNLRSIFAELIEYLNDNKNLIKVSLKKKMSIKPIKPNKIMLNNNITKILKTSKKKIEKINCLKNIKNNEKYIKYNFKSITTLNKKLDTIIHTNYNKVNIKTPKSHKNSKSKVNILSNKINFLNQQQNLYFSQKFEKLKNKKFKINRFSIDTNRSKFESSRVFKSINN